MLSSAAPFGPDPTPVPAPVPGPPSGASASEPAPRKEEREAEPRVLLDNWSLIAREDGAACREELKAAGFKFQAYPEKKEPDKNGCGMANGVVVMRGPTGIVYDPPATVDCTLARALAGVERIVQEEAEAHLGSRIVKIGNLGGYACRPRNFRKGASLSAHAFGSALDLSSFHPAKGQPAIIVNDYEDAPRSTPSRDERQRFLRRVFARLRHHEADLTYVVGPGFNAVHKNHFHLDRGGWHFWFHRDAVP